MHRAFTIQLRYNCQILCSAIACSALAISILQEPRASALIKTIHASRADSNPRYRCTTSISMNCSPASIDSALSRYSGMNAATRMWTGEGCYITLLPGSRPVTEQQQQQQHKRIANRFFTVLSIRGSCVGWSMSDR